MSKRGITTLIGGIALGSAVGTVVGLLFAPRSGKDTRKILRKSAQALPEIAEDVSSSVQLQADRISQTTLNNWDETLNRLKKSIAAGIEASKMETNSVKEKPQSSASNHQQIQ